MKDPRFLTYNVTIDHNTKCGTCGERYGLHIGQYCDNDPGSVRVFTQEPEKVDHETARAREITRALRARAWPFIAVDPEMAWPYMTAQTADINAPTAAHEDSDAAFEAKMKAFLDARGLTVVPQTTVEDGESLPMKADEDPISLITGNTVQPDPFTAEAAYEAFGHLATPKGLLVVSALGSQRMGCAKWQGER